MIWVSVIFGEEAADVVDETVIKNRTRAADILDTVFIFLLTFICPPFDLERM